MATYLQFLTSLFATFGTYGLYRILSFFYQEWTSPLKVLPGPPSQSWLFGNFKTASAALWEMPGPIHEQWVKEYGNTIVYKGILGMNRLYTTDLKALNHIIMNSNTYQKPEMVQYITKRLIGDGLVVVEGEEHKKQRRVMNPAFGPAQIRELTETFVEKSVELRDIWLAQSENAGGSFKVNAIPYFNQLTLDVIGLAGFNYQFHSLTTEAEDNELNNAFTKLFQANGLFSMETLVKALIPITRGIPTPYDKQTKDTKKTMDRIGMELLQKSKAELNEKHAVVERDSVTGKHLLTLLLRANMASDLPHNQRMTDQEVADQVPTFLSAGHETTSTSTSWVLYDLCTAPEVQTKLREELLTIGTDNPTMDELSALPYLDCVVREALRLHAPLASAMRVAVQDDLIPLGTPFTDSKGKLHDVIKVKKGQNVIIPIAAINRDTSLWGDDAHEFRPQRWKELPEAVSGIPGAWSNMLTFLGGPRACIGWRFSIIETKAIIFSILRAFEIQLAVPKDDIIGGPSIISRPVLRTDPKVGMLPLFLKPVSKL
ncbi:cytochrome P450 [Coprinopsis marcescibilis]|uniref:Cytochrome P450 n=1 Tax=Coprinopsis marcescibilis TaxID=230819 RepID=A0A5C3KQJ9_COPMA|nr:cytochrome P450 [Coprinopsis marcescibilis]